MFLNPSLRRCRAEDARVLSARKRNENLVLIAVNRVSHAWGLKDASRADPAHVVIPVVNTLASPLTPYAFRIR